MTPHDRGGRAAAGGDRRRCIALRAGYVAVGVGAPSGGGWCLLLFLEERPDAGRLKHFAQRARSSRSALCGLKELLWRSGMELHCRGALSLKRSGMLGADTFETCWRGENRYVTLETPSPATDETMTSPKIPIIWEAENIPHVSSFRFRAFSSLSDSGPQTCPKPVTTKDKIPKKPNTKVPVLHPIPGTAAESDAAEQSSPCTASVER